MGDLARPMLAECLAVVAERSAWAEHLSAWLRSDLARRERLYPGGWLDLDADEVCLRRRVPSKGLPPGDKPGDKRDVELLGWAPWTITDPADAQETLVARGLLPEGWCGDVRRGWASDYAMPAGSPFDTLPMLGPNPCTIPDLVAVASLGWPAIHRAEELARAACAALRDGGCVCPQRVVWRVAAVDHVTAALVPHGISMAAARVCSCGDVTRGDGGTVVGRVEALAALWLGGLALDAITRDAVRIVVPPVGGAR